VILEIVSWDSSVPIVETRWCWMSRSVMPPAYRLMIISSRPPRAVGVLIGSSLPGAACGVAEVDSEPGVDTKLGVLGHDLLNDADGVAHRGRSHGKSASARTVPLDGTSSDLSG
jgi:hypothetical protein